MENVENFTHHKDLSYSKEFDNVGLVTADAYYGSGTLIHPRVVITAAHVVQGKEKITFYLETEEGVKSIEGKALIHPDYEKNHKNQGKSIHFENMACDAALIILEI